MFSMFDKIEDLSSETKDRIEGILDALVDDYFFDMRSVNKGLWQRALGLVEEHVTALKVEGAVPANKAWQDFVKKSEIASKANAEHEQAKEQVRVYLKQTLGLGEDVVIDFSKNVSDNTITVTEKLEKKVKRVTGGDLLDDKF
jgi:hypothetical protein